MAAILSRPQCVKYSNLTAFKYVNFTFVWPWKKLKKSNFAHTGDHSGRYALDTLLWFPVEILLYDPRKWYILSDKFLWFQLLVISYFQIHASYTK